MRVSISGKRHNPKQVKEIHVSNGDGEYAGLDIELAAEIANRLNMNLDLKLMDWTDAYEQFLSGEADAILNIETDLITGDDRMIATIPTIEKQYVVYGRDKISAVYELYGKKIVSLHAMSELELDEGITYVASYTVLNVAR